jgi:hypothetical protein
MDAVQEPQAAAAVLMVRPLHFAANPETLASNAFQRTAGGRAATASRDAAAEFDAVVEALIESGVTVETFPGHAEAGAPDEVFPNNWVSFHADGTATLYPMMAANRRRERRREFLDALATERGYALRRIIDLSGHETRRWFLEGTGSLVLDRKHRVAYACESPRTHPQAAADFAVRLGYETRLFRATDRSDRQIYHTNVVMSVGSRFTVVCLEAIAERIEREALQAELERSGRELIALTRAQMHAFAANILELKSTQGPVIAMSTRALEAYTRGQRSRLERYGALVAAPIPTLETLGGGSLRCMLAEIHLPLSSG